MKNSMRYFRVSLFYGLLAALSWGCDTSRNTEDPDLHYFIKYYGGDGNQRGVDMVKLSDGTFLLLGTDSKAVFESAIYLVRVNADGDVMSELTYGNPGEIWTAKDLEPTNDGNFVVVADYKTNVDAPNTDIKLVKFSPDGAFISAGTYGTQGNDLSRTVTALQDNSFIISGTTDSTKSFNLSGETDPDLGDIFNIRVDENLKEYSSNNWGPAVHGFGSNIDVAVKIFPATAGNYYVFGFTNSTLAGDVNPNERLGLFYFERIEPNGTTARVWYPGNIVNVNDTEINYVQTVDAAFGGGYLLVGTSRNNVGVSEMFVARLRPTLTFSNPVSNDASFYNTIPLAGNIRGISAATSVVGETGYLILGDEVRSTGATNFWLSKIDQSGKVLWSTTFGSEAENDNAAAVTELSDGKIVILGTMGLANNQTKMAFVKVNRRGQFLK